MKKNYTATIIFSLLFWGGEMFSQNIAINTTGAGANAVALLEIGKGTLAIPDVLGVLIPRVNLTSTASNLPIGAGIVASLLVYNNATVADITPGYYYWDGVKWVRLLNGGTAAPAWLTLGNAGTTAGTNFLGTTDAQDVVIKANNTEGFRLYSGGIMASLGVGVGAAPITTSAQASLVLRSSSSNFQINAQDGGGRTSFLWNASGTGGIFLVSNEPATRMTESINGTVGGTFSFWGAGSPANVLTAGNPILWTQTGFISSNDQIWLSPRGTSSDFFISTAGNVGVGTTVPSNLIHVVGNNDNNGNYYSQVRIDGTGAYPLNMAGISLNPNTAGVQSHIRFLENGTPKVQIRFNNGNTADNKLKIYSWTTGTDFVTFDAGTGNVGIGTTAPAQALHIVGTERVSTLVSGASGAIVTSNISGDLSINNFSGSASNVLLGNNTWGTLSGLGGVTSSCGTINYVPKMTSASNIGCSQIFDDGTNVGIGWNAPQAKLSLGSGEIGFCRADAADQTNYGRIGMDNGWIAFFADNAKWNTSTSQYNYVNGGGYGGWAAGVRLVSGQIYFDNANGGIDPLSWNTRMFVAQSGNVGIGTTGPNEQLEITKNFRLPATTGATAGVIYSGANRYIHNYGTDNFFSGVNAGNFTMTGGYNTASGVSVLQVNTTGSNNTATGWNALISNTTGFSNTVNGANALRSNTTGGANTANGESALRFNTIGSFNTASGGGALWNNTTGTNNTANGMYALYSNVAGNNATAIGTNAMQYANSTATAFTNYNLALGYEALRGSVTASANTGNWNTALGYQSLWSTTTGVFNTATGFQALYKNADGVENTANGYTAMYSNTSGAENTAFGDRALYSNLTGNFNTADGFNTLQANSSGVDNTAIGYSALTFITTGMRNTGIGRNAIGSVTTNSYNTALGYYAYIMGDYSNSMALGANAYAITANNMITMGDPNITYAGCKVGWTTISDARVKKNVQENVPGLAFIKELRPVTYYYDRQKENEILGIKDTTYWEGKYDIDKIQFSGFLAQEVDAAAKKIGYDFSGVSKTNSLWGLKYGEFTVPLVKAVQELNAKNEEQQKIIDSQQSAIDKLKTELSTYDARLKNIEQSLGTKAEK